MATAKKTPSTAVAVKKSTAVVNIQEQLRAQAAADAARNAPTGGKTIRTTGKTFTLLDGSKTREAINVVVLDFVYFNSFYEDIYDPKNIVPPNCFAISIEPKGMVPSASSPDVQADSCNECPNNQFGSDGGGKACKNSVKLAVMLASDDPEEGEIGILTVSPTALRGWAGYVGSVNRTFQLPPVGVVTSVDFDQSKDFPSLTFAASGLNEQVGGHFARKEEARELLMQEPDVSSFGADKASAKAAATPARRPATAARR